LPAEAERIARRLALPLASGPFDERFPFVLALTEARLELRQRGPNAPGPIYADFLSGAVAHRRRFGGGRNQALARAVGLKAGLPPPRIFDATAGLGRDAFVLVCLGCRVDMMERSAIISELLRDGLMKAMADPEIGSMVEQRLTLRTGDSLERLKNLGDNARPQTIYLDPMYPARTKSALVKKEMRTLQSIVGADDDAPELLAAALECARHRVVVKRPRLASPLAGPPPDTTIITRTTRFDVYLTATRLSSHAG
jgi:16S rRNA (guanine1516-N2)-methyltransferase